MIRRGVAILLALMICLSIAAPFKIIREEKVEVIPLRQHVLSFIDHEPFNITSDADFDTQGWPGNGSISNPYVIENLNITTTSSYCIWIMNTTSHFSIRNCFFICPYSFWLPGGYIFPVSLSNVSNGHIAENQIVASWAGISCYDVSNCSITHNQFNVKETAIKLKRSNFTDVLNNEHRIGSPECGIRVYDSNNCTISSNRMYEIHKLGIHTSGNQYSIFTNNTVIAELNYKWSHWGICVGGESCIVSHNNVALFDLYGIEVQGSGNVVERNNVTSNDSGLLIIGNMNIVRRNTFTNNIISIEVALANETEVFENEICGELNRSDAGIVIHGGYYCDIHSNNITHVGFGITLQGANGFNISNNSILESRYGFAFSWNGYTHPRDLVFVPDGPADDCNIANNIFDRGGLFSSIPNYDIWDFNTIRFSGNTANGKVIGFFAYQDDLWIYAEDYGQLFLVSCRFATIIGGPISGVCSDIGEGANHDPGQAAAITLINCFQAWLDVISFHSNTIGVCLQYSDNCKLSVATIYDHSWAAAILWYSDGFEVWDVDFRNNRKAITLGWSYGCDINDCSIWDNENGIYLVSSPSCIIRRNTIFQNLDAIILAESDDCQMRENSIYRNSRGILLNSSSDCFITRNNVYDNSGVGICLDRFSNHNDIYDNTFIDNFPNAICEGSSNQWDDGFNTGNWWSDFFGIGVYVIDEDDMDNYPINTITVTPTETTTPTTLATTIEPWVIDPFALVIASGVVGLVLMWIMIIDRRRVEIID